MEDHEIRFSQDTHEHGSYEDDEELWCKLASLEHSDDTTQHSRGPADGEVNGGAGVHNNEEPNKFSGTPKRPWKRRGTSQRSSQRTRPKALKKSR